MRIITLAVVTLAALPSCVADPGPSETDAGPVAIEQSAECGKYVECQRAVDIEAGTDSTEALLAYEEGGDCWDHGNLDEAEDCTEACAGATEQLRTAYPDIAECQ